MLKFAFVEVVTSWHTRRETGWKRPSSGRGEGRIFWTLHGFIVNEITWFPHKQLFCWCQLFSALKWASNGVNQVLSDPPIGVHSRDSSGRSSKPWTTESTRVTEVLVKNLTKLKSFFLGSVFNLIITKPAFYFWDGQLASNTCLLVHSSCC